MSEKQTVERRREERRKDVASARSHRGMERRHEERRRDEGRWYWDGKSVRLFPAS